LTGHLPQPYKTGKKVRLDCFKSDILKEEKESDQDIDRRKKKKMGEKLGLAQKLPHKRCNLLVRKRGCRKTVTQETIGPRLILPATEGEEMHQSAGEKSQQ